VSREVAEVSELADVVVVRAAGEFDLLTAGTLGLALHRAASFGKDVVVDLTQATFVDLISMRVIVDAHHRLAAGDHRLVLRNPPPLVERLADLLDVHDLVAR
jgi:anti-anti-sigma factor